jgi:hypothetical protein
MQPWAKSFQLLRDKSQAGIVGRQGLTAWRPSGGLSVVKRIESFATHHRGYRSLGLPALGFGALFAACIAAAVNAETSKISDPQLPFNVDADVRLARALTGSK